MAQEVFDKVAAHLLEQGECSIVSYPGGGTACAYRGSNGLQCAVGCLIPNDQYVSGMENRGISALLHKYRSVPIVRDVIGPHADLLRILQDMHDSVGPENWRDRLASIGKNLGFDLGVLQ